MEFKDLFRKYSREGKVSWIGIRPQRKGDISVIPGVVAVVDHGLEGDHYSSPGGNRQVTLIQQEHLNAVASFLGRSTIDPSHARRNIVVEGINLLALKDQQFTIGEAVLQYTGECHPCSRMEENLGPGGYNAMRGHGGITAKIIKGGMINLNDPVIPLFETE